MDQPETRVDPERPSARVPDPGADPGADLAADGRADREPACAADEHGSRRAGPSHSADAFERAVRIFRALGDEPRLRTLELLLRGEACVSELAAYTGEPVSTVSHRLRLLRTEGLVRGRREGRHVHYAIADAHVAGLVLSALDHASED